MENKEEKIINRRINRIDIIKSEFVDGYTLSWCFALPEGFNDALDIKFTSWTKNKIAQKKKWTQGFNYEFKSGDIIFNHVSAYTNFGQFIKSKNPIALQVISTLVSNSEILSVNSENIYKSEINKVEQNNEDDISSQKSKYLDNSNDLLVAEFRPNSSKEKLEEVRKFTIKQDQFVSLLKIGEYIDNATSKVINPKYNY
jgi:hypothetical protein